MVQEKFANRFIATESQRKTMEIRTKPVKFLSVGDRVALVSTASQSTKRLCLAILEFRGCLKIDVGDLVKYQQFHRASPAELDAVLSGTALECWGWQLSAVHIFDHPLLCNKPCTGPMVWLYLNPEELSCSAPAGQPDLSDSYARSSTSDLDHSSSISFLERKRSLSPSDAATPTAKQLRTATAEVVEGIDFEDPLARVMCMVLQPHEWNRLKGSVIPCLVRPFRTKEKRIFALVLSQSGYSWVGILSVGHCIPYADATPTLQSACTKGCDKVDLTNLQKKKDKLFCWQMDEVSVLDVSSSVAWVDQSYKNRTFTLPVSRLNATEATHPTSLDLRETCEYFVDLCPDVFTKRIVDTLKNLHGGRIRVGTTCSGSDICITVLRQTLQKLTALLGQMLQRGDVTIGVTSFILSPGCFCFNPFYLLPLLKAFYLFSCLP